MIQIHIHHSGYRYLRVSGEDHPTGGESYVPLHRVIAHLDGQIDQLDDPVEIHHINGCPSHNEPDNLQALRPEDHAKTTREQSTTETGIRQPEGVVYQNCGNCDEGRPHHIYEDEIECVVCEHPTPREGVDLDGRRTAT